MLTQCVYAVLQMLERTCAAPVALGDREGSMLLLHLPMHLSTQQPQLRRQAGNQFSIII